MTTFQPGDRVVFTEDYGTDCREGDTGTVVRRSQSGYLAIVRLDKDGRAPYHVFDRRLRAEPAPAPLSADGEPLLVGDRVLVRWSDFVYTDGMPGRSTIYNGGVGTVVDSRDRVDRGNVRVAVDGRTSDRGDIIAPAGLVHYSDEDFDAVAAPMVGDKVRILNTAFACARNVGDVLTVVDGDRRSAASAASEGRTVAIECGFTSVPVPDFVRPSDVEVVVDAPAPADEPLAPWERELLTGFAEKAPESKPTPVSDSRKVGDTVVIVADTTGHAAPIGTVREVCYADSTDNYLPWRVREIGTDNYGTWIGPADVVTVILPTPKPAAPTGTITVDIKADTSGILASLHEVTEAVKRING